MFGAPHAPTWGSCGVGKRYTSSYDHDLWLVKILERSGLAVKSYHPETLAAEEEKKRKKKFWQNHNAFPGSRECLITFILPHSDQQTFRIYLSISLWFWIFENRFCFYYWKWWRSTVWFVKWFCNIEFLRYVGCKSELLLYVGCKSEFLLYVGCKSEFLLYVGCKMSFYCMSAKNSMGCIGGLNTKVPLFYGHNNEVFCVVIIKCCSITLRLDECQDTHGRIVNQKLTKHSRK